MVEGAALGVVVECIGAATDDHFALVRLRHIAVHGIGHDNHIHAGFDWLGHQSLQSHGFKRQAETTHIGQSARMTCNNHTKLFAGDIALGGLDSGDFAALLGHAGHRTLLDDVHAHV